MNVENEGSRAVRLLRARRRNARVLYVCFVLSGGAGLVYEVVWGSLLGQLVGGTTLTHTVVLAAFMGGLALGNRVGGGWADGGTQPLRLYAYLEAAVGVLGVFSPAMADAAGAVYASLAPRPEGALEWLDLPLRLALAAATILPAAVAMGATLPVLVRAVTESLGGLGRQVGRLYFINSAGATAGALLAGFLLVPRFGYDLSLTIAGTTNLLLALAALALAGRREAPLPAAAPAPASDATARAYPPAEARAALQAVFLSGAAAMIVEVAWTRVLGLTMGGSAHAFALMLATFIAGIAAGGVVAARLARDDRDAYGPLVLAMAVAAGSLVVMIPWYDRLPWIFHRLSSVLARTYDAYPYYLGASTLVAVLAMALPTLALGATLPLASRVATAHLAQAGRRVGGTFSVNTLGNVTGAALGGVVLVPLAGLEATLQIGGAVLALATLRLLLAADLARAQLRLAAGALVLLLASLLAIPGWDPHLLHAGLYRAAEADYGTLDDFRRTAADVRFLFREDDAEASVSVVENDLGTRLLRINGKSDASNGGDVPTQVMVGQLPFLFHPAPKRVLVVGLGSGITVGSLLAHDVERVDVVEISPAVARASRLFDLWSGAPLDDPRVHLHVRDARSVLRTAGEDTRWDVIVSEPSNPWQPGSALLFTSDYYEMLRSRLAPGGVMSQWVHSYEMSDRVLETILRTFGSVFPHARVWNPRGNDMVMVAAPDGLPTDFGHMEGLLRDPEVGREIGRMSPDGAPVDLLLVLSHEVVGPKRFDRMWTRNDGAVLHTDREPVLQTLAPPAFFVGEGAKLFEQVDARRLPRSLSGLLLADRLGDEKLPRAEVERLAGWFLSRGRALDGPVAKALAVALWEEEAADPSAATLQRLADLQVLDLVSEAALWERKTKDGPPADAKTCMAWVSHAFRRMAASVSVFTPPRFEVYDGPRKVCLDRFPELARPIRGFDVRVDPRRVVPRAP